VKAYTKEDQIRDEYIYKVPDLSITVNTHGKDGRRPYSETCFDVHYEVKTGCG
jgi:hypothetical protein